jgi:hypothetical protein
MASSDTPTQPSEQEAQLKAAHEEIDVLEKADELPAQLSDWPGGKAKFLTLGGADDGAPYGEGATDKLGPADLVRHEGGGVSVGGTMVDNPEDYRGEPIPGGPTDPNAPGEPGEAKAEDDAA